MTVMLLRRSLPKSKDWIFAKLTRQVTTSHLRYYKTFPNTASTQMIPKITPSPITVSSLLRPWSGDATTTLTQRCRDAWDTPIQELSDLEVATFISQRIATPEMIVEAHRRLRSNERDGTEYFDGQLDEALSEATR